MLKIIILYSSFFMLLSAQLNTTIEERLVSIDADEAMLLKEIRDEQSRLKLEQEKKFLEQKWIRDEAIRLAREKKEEEQKKQRMHLKATISKLLLKKEELNQLLNKEIKLAKRREAAERQRRVERKRNHIVAHIDISAQNIKIYQGSKLLYKWLVSTARKGYSTPVGKYTPQYLEKMHYSRLYHNSPMPYTVFFSGNYAIHGTNSISKLGQKASHGCVRLHPKNAKVLYSMIKKFGRSNTEIKITH